MKWMVLKVMKMTLKKIKFKTMVVIMMEANASGIRNWNSVSNHSYEIERGERQGGGIEGEDKQKESQTSGEVEDDKRGY